MADPSYTPDPAETHEQYLLADCRRSRLPVTDVDLAHARHLDTGCPICATSARNAHAERRTMERTEAARCVYAVGAHDIRQAIADRRAASGRGADVVAAEDFVAQIERALLKLKAAHDRARRTTDG